MDSGFETIIYILLGIIFIVAQAARKKKQQTAQASVDKHDSEETHKEPVKDFFDEFFTREEYEARQQAKDNPVRSPQIEAQPLSSDFIDKEIVTSESIQKIGKEVRSYEKEISDIENQVMRSERRVAFDLRRAVIYSVILERKYF